MKIRTLIVLLGTAAASAFGESSFCTTPFGAMVLPINAASNAASPGMTAISVPFHPTSVFSGTISSVNSSNTISCGTNAWATGQLTSTPTFFRCNTLPGRRFRVTANSASQLTVATGSLGFTAGSPTGSHEVQIPPGTRFELITANTLGSVFGTASVPLQTGSTAAAADNILLFDGLVWTVYFHNGNSWASPTAVGNQNNTIIPPESALFIRRRNQSPLALTVTGLVSATPEILDLPAGANRFAGHRFPVDATLSTLGIHRVTNWKGGSSAASADGVQMWDGATWQNFFFNGTHWRRSGSLLNFDSLPIPAGSALFIHRRPATNADVSLTFPAPYAF